MKIAARDYNNVNDQAISGRRQTLSEALEHLRSALQLLDRAAAPPQIGAHIDLAVHQLELMVDEQQISSALQIETNADPQ